jgi:hypothetical protein
MLLDNKTRRNNDPVTPPQSVMAVVSAYFSA